MEGARVEVLADELPGPSDLTWAGEYLLVSLAGSDELAAFDDRGREIQRVAAPFDVAGLALGPDGALYVADLIGAAVWRADP